MKTILILLALALTACGGGDYSETEDCKAEFVGPVYADSHPCDMVEAPK